MLKKLMGFVALITIVGTMGIPARADTIFSGKFSGAQVLPPNASKAVGSATVVLNDTATRITISLDFSGLGSNQTAAHIHGPARPGGIAPILFNLGSQGTTSGTLESLSASVSPRQVAQLKAGLWYFDIHSTRLFGGEIRAQILPEAQAPVENASRGDANIPSLYTEGSDSEPIIYGPSARACLKTRSVLRLRRNTLLCFLTRLYPSLTVRPLPQATTVFSPTKTEVV